MHERGDLNSAAMIDHNARSLHQANRPGSVTPQSVQQAFEEFRDVCGRVLVNHAGWCAGFTFRTIAGCERAVLVARLPPGPIGELNWRAFSSIPLIPSIIAGLPVVVEVATECTQCVWPFASPSVRPGYGIRLDGTTQVGTLGCLVRRDGELFGLTCGHVLALGRSSPRSGAHVEWAVSPFKGRPGWMPLGMVAPKAGAAINYKSGEANVDAVLVKLSTKEYSVDVRHIGGIGNHVLEPYLAAATKVKVQKTGATTGRTRGCVQGIWDVGVKLDAVSEIRYRGVLEVRSHKRRQRLCDSGDSGAIFWTKPSRGEQPAAVGLLVSTHLGNCGYAVPMQRVVLALGVTIASR